MPVGDSGPRYGVHAVNVYEYTPRKDTRGECNHLPVCNNSVLDICDEHDNSVMMVTIIK